jgi:transcriptional regulator with XRE-family HTH domain
VDEQERLTRLSVYLEDLKKSGRKVPSRKCVAQPHLKVISAGANIPYRDILTPPCRRRIDLAVQEIGLDKKHISEKDKRFIFERNCKLIYSYLESLEARGQKLPEDPEHPGEVLFVQAEVESGVSCDALVFKGRRTDESYTVHLREIVNCAAPRVGLEVRILPQFLKHKATPITYEVLLEKGTFERIRELRDKRGLRPQLYNTRYALNQFLKAMKLERSGVVAGEFTLDFNDNVERIISELQNSNSRKKFQTEIRWWQNFYKRLLKEQSLPGQFHEAINHLVETSGLSLATCAKLIGVARGSLRKWCIGEHTPNYYSLAAVSRAESVFKLPTGSLTNKISQPAPYGRFKFSQLPAFLQNDPNVAHMVREYLPDDFCELPTKRQREIVNSIHSDIVGDNNPFMQRQVVLVKLQYKLKEWPEQLEQEFDDLAVFKTSERPPIGMQRNGTWKPATKELMRSHLAYFFGAICLPPDADDIRLRGLGVPQDHLTLGLFICPKLVDWYLRFRCENRSSYTDHATSLASTFKSMVRAKTGWVRQHPELASRLRPISWNATELLPPGLIAEACADWEQACEKAIPYYDNLIKEMSRLAGVSRNPFGPIDGIIKMDDPMGSFGYLMEAMRKDKPNRNTGEIYYHVSIRNRVLVGLLAVTGLRRQTLTKLNYTGGKSGNLYLQDGTWVLSVPRSYFKDHNSPYFGPKRAQLDYYMELPNPYGLAELLTEYVTVSRPYLLNKYHPDSEESPLLVSSYQSKGARMTPANVSHTYLRLTNRYLAEKKYRGTGISGVKKHGPHAARHIRGTAAVKKTGSLEVAADANHHSVEAARSHYALFLPKDRNRRVNEALFGSQDGNS